MIACILLPLSKVQYEIEEVDLQKEHGEKNLAASQAAAALILEPLHYGKVSKTDQKKMQKKISMP